MPEVSVIVPVYKVEDYLCRCIDSILAQTFTDFELILVDDGSPDNCGSICDQYSKKDARVHVIHQTNSGVSSARNAGLTYANGCYIMFCDADDWVRIDWIQLMVETIKEDENCWVVCGADFISKENHEILVPTGQDKSKDFLPVSDYFLIHKCALDSFCWNKIYRMDILKQHRIEFRNGVSFGEDLLFNIDYLKHMDGIKLVKETLYYYNRSNEMSATGKYDPQRFEKIRVTYNKRKPLISRHYLAEFSTMFFCNCMFSIECLFDERNEWSLVDKWKYSNYIMQSPEFRECLDNGATHGMNRLYTALLKSGRFSSIYVYNKCKEFLRKIGKDKNNGEC